MKIFDSLQTFFFVIICYSLMKKKKDYIIFKVFYTVDQMARHFLSVKVVCLCNRMVIKLFRCINSP